jgi:hypothetical protein
MALTDAELAYLSLHPERATEGDVTAIADELLALRNYRRAVRTSRGLAAEAPTDASKHTAGCGCYVCHARRG